MSNKKIEKKERSAPRKKTQLTLFDLEEKERQKETSKEVEILKLPYAITDEADSPILKAKCWILSNGLFVIQGRGYVRTLSGVDDDQKISGQRLQRMLASSEMKDIISKDVFEKLTKPIIFIDKKRKKQEGYDATTIPSLARDFREAFLLGKIPKGHTYYQEGLHSKFLVNAFLNLSIKEHIKNITGHVDIQQIQAFFVDKYISKSSKRLRRKI